MSVSGWKTPRLSYSSITPSSRSFRLLYIRNDFLCIFLPRTGLFSCSSVVLTLLSRSLHFVVRNAFFFFRSKTGLPFPYPLPFSCFGAFITVVFEAVRRRLLNRKKAALLIPCPLFIELTLTVVSRFVRCPCRQFLVRTGRFYGPDEDEGDVGELPGATSGQGRGDGTGVLQRLSETSHQGRRPHRGGLQFVVYSNVLGLGFYLVCFNSRLVFVQYEYVQ